MNYTGTENLQVMAQAKNVNSFLLSQIERSLQSVQVLTASPSLPIQVLDFGAGLGHFAFSTQQQNPQIKMVAVEIDPHFKKMMKERGLIVLGELKEMASESVDFFYSFDVLEHIERDEDSLQQLARVLKREGTGLIYVPAFPFLFGAMDFKVGHYRRYLRSSLVEKLKRNGFSIIEASYVDPIGFFASLANKFLGNKNGDINLQAVQVYDRYLWPLSIKMSVLTKNFLGKNLLVRVKKN